MRDARRPKTFFRFLLAAILLGGSAVARGSVTIKREPPVVEYKIFDPADPPKDMPKLHPGEDAVTETVFRCLVNARYSVTDRKAAAGQKVATIELSGLQLTLRLRVIIYLQKDAPEKLKAHEEGHRRVAEQIYRERAEKAARGLAAQADGRTFQGEGIDDATAAKAAVQTAIGPVASGYLKLTGDVSGRVGDIYDELTAHGVNRTPEDEAIKRAFEQYEKEQAEKSAPATTRSMDERKR